MSAGPAALAAPPQAPRRSTEILTFDPGAMSMALQEGVLEHVQLERGNFSGRIAHTAAAETRVDWGRYELAVLARGDTSGEMVTLALAIDGLGDWRVYGQAMVDGDMVAFAERGELLIALPRRAQWLALQVPRRRLEAAGLAPGSLPASGAQRMRGRLDAGLRQTLADVAPVLAPLAVPAPFKGADVERAHDQLLTAVLTGWVRRSSSDKGNAALQPAERWRVIRRAEAYLESSGAASVRIDDLCVAACTSLSRLERAFREAFGLNPRRYLMLRRLAAVRGELLDGGAPGSITEIATRWGFFHLGRFAQEYRLHFGERPSDTLGQRRR